MTTLEVKAYELLKAKFGDENAGWLIQYIDEKTEKKMAEKVDLFLTKDDKVDLIRSIYFVGLVQFLAIVGSVVVIVNFMSK
jgi:hypothetical protein